MKSFRQILPAICVILIASAFAGCGADADSPDKRPALGKIEYTNLNDSGSRELLQGLLSGAGVSDGRIQGFFRRVDHFNGSVKQEWLTDGFEEAELLYTKYIRDRSMNSCEKRDSADAVVVRNAIDLSSCNLSGLSAVRF